MQEQLISFETAKLAKEKGFKSLLPLNGYYPNGEFTRNPELGSPEKGWGIPENNYKAPTQSLLQKWLRDKFGTIVNATSQTIGIEGDWKDWTYSIRTNSSIRQSDHRNGFDTYEEALEQGLIQALKLIKS